MKNLFFFNQRSNAAAQATECAYTTGQKFGVTPTKTSTFGRFATYIGLALVMLVTLGVGEMKAGASWMGNSYIVANGTWYKGSGSGDLTAFNSASLGTITSLTLGGEVQTYGQSDGTGNPAKMHYKIDNGTSSFITLYWFKYESNNNFFHSNSNGSTSNGNAFASKTVNISGLSAGNHSIAVWFEQPDGSQWDSNGGSNYVASFTIDPIVTFKANGGTGSDYTQTVTYNSSTALTACTFTRSGYAFAGWATSSDGSVVYADGANVTLTANTNLFAKWTAKTYSITLDDNGDYQGNGSATATYGSSSLDVSSHASRTSWNLTGYWTASGSGGSQVSDASGNLIASVDGFTDSNAKWIKDATCSLYAHWSQSYSVTYNANGGTGTTTDASSPYTPGSDVTVLSNSFTRTGYTFTGWNTSAEGDGTPYAAGATISSIAANVTLYAQWSEKKTTVTISASPAGTGTFTVNSVSGTSASVGVTTTATIVATPATDFEFTSWAATNCSASPTNNKSTTLTGNGSSASGTLVATFTENVASGWYLGGTDFGNSWDVGNTAYPLTKKYRGMAGVFYRQGTVTTAAYDALHNGTTRYRPTSNATFSGAGWSNKISLSSTTANANYRFKTAGTYYIIADTRGATPVIWYETSEPDRNNYHSVNVTGVVNAKGTCKVTLGSTSGFETTRFANGETFYVTITGVSGWIPTITIGGVATTFNKEAATYTASGTMSTSDVTVAISYTASYTVTYEVGTVKGNKNDIKLYVGSIASGNIISSGTKVKSGTEVFFWVNNNTTESEFCKPGYNWWGFRNAPAGTDPTQYTNASVTVYHPYITANTTVYAVFGEKDYTVKIINNGNGDVYEGGSIVTATTAHVATASNTLTATPQTGYYFTGWDQFSDSLTISSPSTASTTIKIKDTKLGNNARLRANYSPRWSVLGTGAFGGWSATGTNLFINYEVVSGDDEGYYSIDLAANTDYEVKVYDRQTSTTYGGSSAQNVYYSTSGSDKPFTMATTSSEKSLTIHSAAAGEYWLNWNLTDKALALVYPTSWYITTGVNDALGGSFTAVDNSSNNVYGGKFVADEATVTFEAEANTGYTFDGWYDNSDYAVEHKYADGDDIDISGTNGKILEISSIGADKSVYAKFTAKEYTVALDMQSGATGYGSGSNRNETVTYNATLTTVGSLPTAANGYAFMGFYSGTGGKGTQFINASGTWATSVTDTISDSKWVLDAGATLYAYYKKAEITELTVSPSTVGTGEEVTATPTIYPTPTGSYKVCWKILRNNGNVLTEDGFSEGDDDAVTFDAPTVSGTYKVACVLRTGSACNGGIVLDSVVTDFVVAGVHTVAIRYQDSDGRTLAASTEVSAKPLEWSDDITAPSITGYTFSYWNAGDGITLKTANNVNPTQIKANYGGNLTAVYTKKKMVYFNNTLGWSDVYVYFYNDGDGDEYWANNYGTGANKQQSFNGHKPYWEAQFGHMTQIEGTDIWYYDYLAAGVPSGRTKVAFATVSQSINKSGASNDEAYFHNASVVYRTDFDGTNLPMFVPINSVVHDYTANTGSKYYRGYWMNYPNNTGYTLKIFDKVSGTPAPVQVQSIPFEFTGDLTMPMSVTAELEGGRTYGFKIYRNDATWWGNNGTMKINASGDTGQTVWEFETGKNNCGLTTSVAGDYTFTLTYGAKGSTYYYLVGVHYPVAKDDYRIMYKDLATWSQGSAHTSAWGHPSRAIHKEDGAKDIVSFYVSKADGASATMKFQYASAISNEGVVTWTDVTSGSIDLTGIEESGVYNFHLTQADGAISVEKIEKYDGNYYIRTDCAGTTKWDNYRADDHKMSYSEFSMSSANSFGEKYSHYYTHWCPRGTNVKFVVANDYSSCVSDTLIRDVGDPYSNIYENDGGGRADGELKAETYSGTTPSSDPTADKYSANIRFMYNESTNKISRAYLSSSTNQSRKFLVLKGEDEFWNGDGTNLSGTGESHDNHEAIFVDDEDWIYEREIKVTPGTLFKLYACYAQSSPEASTAQYFRGAYNGGDFTEDVNSIVLIGGTGSASKTRIVYDFKTNRLMAAYQPEEGDIEGVQAIKADIMLVREHQEAGQQLTFKDESSKLTEVKTVYGVMRFNRWTLNNRANPEDHDKDHSDTDGDITTYHPLLDAGSQKSTSERGLYWISFPFDVNLSEVFGFGTYGRHWAIMYYDGAARAEKGYWTDSEGFWEFYEDRKDVTLEAGKGYVLGLDLDLMKANDRDFWANEIQQVELFFPSTASAGTIQRTNATVSVPSHECTIDRTGNNGSDINKNRKIADSHWNVIGVPSYANYGSTLSDGTNTITWHAPNTNNLPFLYEWNMADNSYTPQTGSTYSFKAMHAYMVQYQGTLVWSLASATPSSPVARRAADLPQQNIEFRLELQQNDKMTDQTFVKLSDNEEVSANFAFDEDMMKEMNKGKANIYTMVEGYIPTAGNTLPMSEQTTVVPVGVKIAQSGDYTFSIPDGTSGVGVTLIDTENNIRTNLSAVDYTVSLESGQNDNRFVLEISPIQHIATEIETSDIGDQKSDVRKLLIDGLLYIVRDGKVYDARGARIE